MSISQDLLGLGRRATEKSKFSQTCSLLNQYLREKRSLGVTTSPNSESGNNSEMFPPETMNLLSSIETSDDVSDVHEKTTEPENAEMIELPTMTIFYDGEVHVFDKLSAEKAKEVMLLAKKGLMSASSDNDDQKFVSDKSSEEATTQLPCRSHVSEIPMMRKASIHRFLEKRKDRLSATVPYQVSSDSHNNSTQECSEILPPRPHVSEIPMTRRASIHKFLEKRKDRLAAKTASDSSHQTQECPELPPRHVPMTRKASLNRFMEKRKHRLCGAAPYQQSSGSDQTNPAESNTTRLQLASESVVTLDLLL